MLRWVKVWIADLAMLNDKFRGEDGRVNFEALGREEYAFRQAIITGALEKSERGKAVYMKSERELKARSDAGRINIQKRWGVPAGPMPADKMIVVDFANKEGLDVDDACECWYVTNTERGGKTADGKNIIDWKGYTKRWCKSRKDRRNA